MSDLFWLTDAQMARLEPFFPKPHGKPRVDDRRVLSGIIFINRNGLRWRDAPAEYGSHKTLYNRWKRWSDKGIFARMMAGLAAGHGEEKTVMIDATYLKAHRTATSMGVKKSFFATLECELLERRKFRTKTEARIACFELIEGWYKPSRRHSALGYKSPINYERTAAEGLESPSP